MSRGAAPATRRQPKAPLRQRLSGLFRAVAVVAGLAVAAGAGWGGVLLFDKLDRPIAVIGVDGEIERVRAGEVESIVARELDGGFLSLDLAGICEALEAHPWIESASARRRWPDQVVIHIDEETPIARWGEDGFLNNRGKTLDIGQVENLDELPLLAGPDGNARQVMKHYREMAQMLRPTGLRITVFRQAERGSWELQFEQGPTLVVGREDVAQKLRRFLLVWNRELKDRVGDIAAVDIRYGNGVAVRWQEPRDSAST